MTINFENAVDLDAILAAANEDYRHVPMRTPSGTEFLLRNVLQLDRSAREAVTEAQKGFEDEDIENVEVIRAVLRLVSDNEGAFDELWGSLGDNPAAKVTVFKFYNKRTQAGEA